MDLGSEDELIESLFLLTRKEQRFIQRNLKQYGLNVMQAKALNFIAQHPGAIQKELSHYLSKQEASTTNILKVLESRRFIVRRITAANERKKKLYLSPDGQELVQSVRRVFVDLEKRVSATLSATERKTMIQLLARINEQVSFD